VKAIAPSSQIALLVFAGILITLGGMIGSPDGRLLVLVLAGLCTLPIIILDSSLIRRMLAAILLVAAIFQVIPAWHQHREDSHIGKSTTARSADSSSSSTMHRV
jgi:hypothetical protein